MARQMVLEALTKISCRFPDSVRTRTPMSPRDPRMMEIIPWIFESVVDMVISSLSSAIKAFFLRLVHKEPLSLSSWR